MKHALNLPSIRGHDTTLENYQSKHLVRNNLFAIFARPIAINTAYGTTHLQSLGRFGQDLHPGRTIYQAVTAQPAGLSTDFGRHLHQQGHGRDEGAHPEPALRHQHGADRQRPLRARAANLALHRNERAGDTPACITGPERPGPRLQPFPRGDHRQLLSVGDAQPEPRARAQPGADRGAGQQPRDGRRRGEHDAEAHPRLARAPLADGVHRRAYRAEPPLERDGRGGAVWPQYLQRGVYRTGRTAAPLPGYTGLREAVQATAAGEAAHLGQRDGTLRHPVQRPTAPPPADRGRPQGRSARREQLLP